MVVKLMTAMLFVTATIDLYDMADPELGQYTKLLDPEAQEEIAPIVFENYGFVFALIIELEGYDTIPKTVGRFVVNKHKGKRRETQELVDCREFFDAQSLQFGAKNFQEALRNGNSLCLDPTYASTTVFSSGDSKPDADT